MEVEEMYVNISDIVPREDYYYYYYLNWKWVSTRWQCTTIRHNTQITHITQITHHTQTKLHKQ
jgi:hypothetical protein